MRVKGEQRERKRGREGGDSVEIALKFQLRNLGFHILEVQSCTKCLTKPQVLFCKMKIRESVLITHVIL